MHGDISDFMSALRTTFSMEAPAPTKPTHFEDRAPSLIAHHAWSLCSHQMDSIVPYLHRILSWCSTLTHAGPLAQNVLPLIPSWDSYSCLKTQPEFLPLGCLLQNMQADGVLLLGSNNTRYHPALWHSAHLFIYLLHLPRD